VSPLTLPSLAAVAPVLVPHGFGGGGGVDPLELDDDVEPPEDELEPPDDEPPLDEEDDVESSSSPVVVLVPPSDFAGSLIFLLLSGPASGAGSFVPMPYTGSSSELEAQPTKVMRAAEVARTHARAVFMRWRTVLAAPFSARPF